MTDTRKLKDPPPPGAPEPDRRLGRQTAAYQDWAAYQRDVALARAVAGKYPGVLPLPKEGTYASPSAC